MSLTCGPIISVYSPFAASDNGSSGMSQRAPRTHRLVVAKE
jgi:hypothetical protein